MLLTANIKQPEVADYSSSESDGDDNLSMESNSKVDDTHF
jgi:hypothetical protein